MPMMWDLFNEPFDIRPDGMVHAPGRAGLGFTLRADALERFRYVAAGPSLASARRLVIFGVADMLAPGWPRSLIEEARFAPDSPLEQAGFEPSVPLKSQAEPDLVLPEHLP
jgi:hypothetical protein